METSHLHIRLRGFQQKRVGIHLDFSRRNFPGRVSCCDPGPGGPEHMEMPGQGSIRGDPTRPSPIGIYLPWCLSCQGP